MKLLLNALITAAALAGGCVYNADERCGPAMSYDAALGACACDSDAVPTGLGCTPCAPDEVVVGGACACPTGTAKNDANVCEVVVGLGDACTGSASCTSAPYDYCAPATAGSTANTCTSECASDADCGAAYTCATWEAHPYCRTFTGLGKSCASGADCAGLDAAYCESAQSHVCLVSSCSLTASDCPRGTQCCDFSNYGLGTLCAEACQ